jgi:tyrosyl-tRNA synthetase
MPGDTLARNELAAGIGVLELFVRAGLAASNGEARRLVQQGGARINDTVVPDATAQIDASWAPDDELVLRAGKKRYFRFTVSA